jgi:hypothetical protein
MPVRDPVLTPDLIRVLKFFLLSSFGIMVVFSLFNSYRANNSGKDRTFSITDSDKLYFINVRSIHYDQELRRDAGMTLFRHGKRILSDSVPKIEPVIILNPLNAEAYIYFELKNAEFPVQIVAKSGTEIHTIEFSIGNNSDHFATMKKLNLLINNDFDFYLIQFGQEIPLWSSDKEKEILKTVFGDYFRLLNQLHQ